MTAKKKLDEMEKFKPDDVVGIIETDPYREGEDVKVKFGDLFFEFREALNEKAEGQQYRERWDSLADWAEEEMKAGKDHGMLVLMKMRFICEMEPRKIQWFCRG
ncbi:MAG: hypothetical protein KGL39_31990 [Patescibacteria group bacterium]|nr:hypothetical protein [Patescibacteria group bacterium]